MARQTMKAQIEALRTENEQLRAMCSEWASDAKRARRDIVKLKAQRAANHRDMREDHSVPTLGECARLYCEQFGVRSVSAAELRRYMEH